MASRWAARSRSKGRERRVAGRAEPSRQDRSRTDHQAAGEGLRQGEGRQVRVQVPVGRIRRRDHAVRRRRHQRVHAADDHVEGRREGHVDLHRATTRSASTCRRTRRCSSSTRRTSSQFNDALDKAAGGWPGPPEGHDEFDGPPPPAIHLDAGNFDGSGGLKSSGVGFNPGDTYSVTFTKAGTYPYACLIHPGMIGKVVVK